MLGALLLAVGVRTAKSTFFYFDPSIAIGFRQFGLSACLLIGPLTYLYISYHLADLQQRSEDGRWRLHLGLWSLVIGIGILFPYADYRAIWDYSSYAIHMVWFAYLAASAQALWHARHHLAEPATLITTRTLLPLSVFAGSFLILAAYVSTPLTSYIVGALSFTFFMHIAVLVFLLRKESPVTKEKYQNRRLSEEDAETILSMLDKQMNEQSLHSNPNLTLAQLAKRTGNVPAEVSQVLNDKLKKSFNLYVNEFRIANAKTLLLAEPQLNLETIAERCGFNSSSTFFAVFKKIAGQTPASYRTSTLHST